MSRNRRKIKIELPLSKHYNHMNRNEKRAYKKWLKSQGIWDGAEVVERMTRDSSLDFRK